MVIATFGLFVGPAVAVGYVAARRVLPGPWPLRGLVYGLLLAALVIASFESAPADEAGPDALLAGLERPGWPRQLSAVAG